VEQESRGRGKKQWTTAKIKRVIGAFGTIGITINAAKRALLFAEMD
jgi:hypothetical protein